MNDPRPRQFDDRLAGEVLRRAAELQHESNVPMAVGEGLSATQLEEIAREVSQFLRDAATEFGVRVDSTTDGGSADGYT